MKHNVVDLTNKVVGEIELDDSIFAGPVREHLFWEVINWQRARRRAGTHKTKGRSEVKGGGRKLYRQKGTGRARAGGSRSPVRVGGGTVFGPQPRDYSYKISKKKRRAALRSALSKKVADGSLRVVDSLDFAEAKTKAAASALSALDAQKALCVDVTSRDEGSNAVQHNETLRLSVRNLPNAKYIAAEGLNVEDLLRYDALVISRAALEQVQEVLR